MESLGKMFKAGLARIRLRANTREFGKGDYLEVYANRTNLLVDVDPKMAIGGIWDEMGAKQFELLKRNGLEPHHSLLDIGCGTLRGGAAFHPIPGTRKIFGLRYLCQNHRNGR